MVTTDFFLGFGHSILAVFFGTLSLIGITLGVLIAAGLIFVWVRFMLAATRAAQVYVDLHSGDAARAGAATSAPKTAAASASASGAKASAAKAAPKPRTAPSAAAKPRSSKPSTLPKD